MMTQTVVESQKELTTYSFFVPAKEFDDENRRNLVASQCSILVRQPITNLPKIDLYNCWEDIRSRFQTDIVNELVGRMFYSLCWADNTGQTETISREASEIPNERSASNVIVSEKVAAKLRAKEVSAFVPVSAADLVWLEALSMDEDPDG